MKRTSRDTFWTAHCRWARPVMLLALSFAVLTTALAEEEKAEIKLFVVEDKIDEARKQIEKEFNPTGPTRHEIYFFDTAALGLYENADGPVILRARQKGTKDPQSTVKLRRGKRDPDLEKKLTAIRPKLEFEIEPEAIVGKNEPSGISYALDAKPGKKLSELEGATGQKISGWFSADQKKFLEAAGIKVDWGDLKVFGRIDADVWEWEEKKDKRIDTEVTAELWPLGDKRIYELSCKKKGGDLAKQKEDFAAFFKEKNIQAAENSPSKTKQALDYFSKKAPSQSKTATATEADRWHKVEDGKLMGIGGMALLERGGDSLSFLVVHDNKNAGETRAGVLRCERGGKPKYQRLDWPATALPVDLEALTAVPGARGEYLAATSKGNLYRIKASSSGQNIEVLAKLDDIPGATERSEIEGFALALLGDNVVAAAWADRGDDEKAATFSWANFDATSNQLTGAESTTIKVPWPEKNARDVSDIRIDEVGAVFITSAYESKDDASNATFASAVYLAGVLKREGKQFRFSQNTELTRLYHFEGRKIEALELVSGAKGGLVLATDDEHQGSSLYLGW
ncbi:MAG: hypothetical protein LC642_06380 [Verrucomicrobiaceae bacterium]|nr:hypothetical protein [Verrucomicrobiaceae bacterium]